MHGCLQRPFVGHEKHSSREAKFTTPEEWETYEQVHYPTWKTVVQALKGAFHERDVVDKAQEKLMRIKQRNRSAEEYILEFERYEINAELNEAANFLFFKSGLSESLLKSISSRKTEKNLTAYKEAARDIQRDEKDVHEFLANREPQRFPPRFQAGSSNQQHFAPRFRSSRCSLAMPLLKVLLLQHLSTIRQRAPPAFRSTPVPMDVGRARQSRPIDLSKIECFKCRQKGHYARDCQTKIARIIEQKDGSVQSSTNLWTQKKMKQQQLRLKKRPQKSSLHRIFNKTPSDWCSSVVLSPSFPIFNRFSLLNSDVPAPSAENVIELVGPINMVPRPKTEQKIRTTIIGNGIQSLFVMVKLQTLDTGRTNQNPGLS